VDRDRRARRDQRRRVCAVARQQDQPALQLTRC
jgi:hypothetical protein